MATDDTDLTTEEKTRLVAAAKALDSELPPDNPLAGPPVLTLEQLRVRYTAHVVAWTDSRREAAEVLGEHPSTLYRRTRGGARDGPAGNR